MERQGPLPPNTITWFDGHVVRFVSAHRDSITPTSPRLDNCRRVLYIHADSVWSSGIVSQVSSPRCSAARLPAGISARRGQCCPSPGICHGFLACLVNGLLSFGRILVGPSRYSTYYYTTGRGASPIASILHVGHNRMRSIWPGPQGRVPGALFGSATHVRAWPGRPWPCPERKLPRWRAYMELWGAICGVTTLWAGLARPLLSH